MSCAGASAAPMLPRLWRAVRRTLAAPAEESAQPWRGFWLRLAWCAWPTDAEVVPPTSGALGRRRSMLRKLWWKLRLLPSAWSGLGPAPTGVAATAAVGELAREAAAEAGGDGSAAVGVLPAGAARCGARTTEVDTTVS